MKIKGRVNDDFMKPSKQPQGYIVTTALNQTTALSTTYGNAIGTFGTNTWDINSKNTWSRGKEANAEIGLAIMSTVPKVLLLLLLFFLLLLLCYYRLQMR